MEQETLDTESGVNRQQPGQRSDSLSPGTGSSSLDKAASVASNVSPLAYLEEERQLSHRAETPPLIVQDSEYGEEESAHPPQTGLLVPVSSPQAHLLVDKPSQPQDALPRPPSFANVPTILAAPSEQNLSASHSLPSQLPELVRPEGGAMSSPGWLETKSALEAARNQARVEPLMMRQRRLHTISAAPIGVSAQPDEVQHSTLPATLTEKQDPGSLLEDQIETTEDPIAVLAKAETNKVSPLIKIAPRAEPEIPQKPAALSVQQDVASPEPVIYVTIGRIEVRATQPAPAKREAQPKPSTMGLEQYLKRFGEKR